MDRNIQIAAEERAFGKPVLMPTFFLHARKDDTKSFRFGINIYVNELYVRIKTKGRKDDTVRKATQNDVQLFSHAYEKFVGENDRKSQTLETLPGYNTALGFIFRDLEVHSIEELLAYKGPYPLAEMKHLWHVANYIQSGLRTYQPPVYQDEVENNHAIMDQTGGQELHAQRGVNGREVDERVSFGDKASNGAGAGPIRFGAVFDESGQAHIEHY